MSSGRAHNSRSTSSCISRELEQRPIALLVAFHVFPQSSLAASISAFHGTNCRQIGTWLTPSILNVGAASEETTQPLDLQVLQALFRTRTGDPLLTMNVRRGSIHAGFGLTVPLRLARKPPRIAAFCGPVRPWCDHGYTALPPA